jgi:hypothetical protein
VLLGRLTTIPSRDRWDGISSMLLACGPGENHPAGADPDLDKIRAAESNPGSVAPQGVEPRGGSGDGLPRRLHRAGDLGRKNQTPAAEAAREMPPRFGTNPVADGMAATGVLSIGLQQAP